MRNYDVFISHSSADKAWTRRFAESLKHRGLRVWLDEEQLDPGKPIAREVAKGLRASTYIVTVINPKSLENPNTFFELGAAAGMGKKVVLVVPKGLRHEIPVPEKYVVTKSTPARTADVIRDSILRPVR